MTPDFVYLTNKKNTRPISRFCTFMNIYGFKFHRNLVSDLQNVLSKP